MEFIKGEKLKVTKANGDWDGATMQYKDEIDIVTVKKIIRRNGQTRIHVVSQYGYGYTIIYETFITRNRCTIEKI